MRCWKAEKGRVWKDQVVNARDACLCVCMSQTSVVPSVPFICPFRLCSVEVRRLRALELGVCLSPPYRVGGRRWRYLRAGQGQQRARRTQRHASLPALYASNTCTRPVSSVTPNNNHSTHYSQ